MILVDTSVWIEHFRSGHPELVRLLERGEAAMHPMIVGELACGKLPKRASTLHLLQRLPQIGSASGANVLHAVETQRWFGSGIGWVDAHLLTSALLSHTRLWTLDVRLAKLARSAHVAYSV
jgi:predicted nucleic acid-binding protein